MGKKFLILAVAGSLISKPSRSMIHRAYFEIHKIYTRLIYKFKIIPVIDKLNRGRGNNVIVVSLDAESQQILRRAGIKPQSQEQYLDKELNRRITEEARDFVIRLTELDGNLIFKNSSSYRGISMGSMMALEIWDFFVKINRTIILVERIIETEKPDEIIVFDRSGINGQLANEIGKSTRVPVSCILPDSVSKIKLFFTQKFMLMTLKYIRRKNLALPRTVKTHVSSKDKNRILIGYFGRFNSMYVPIIRELKKNEKNEIVVVGVGGLIGSEGSIESSKIAFLKEGVEFKYFEDYVDKSKYDKITSEIKLLDAKFSQLKRDAAFKKNLSHKNIQLWSVLKDKFMFLYTVRFPKIVEYIETMDNIIELEAPDVILLGDDMSSFGKTFIEVANQKKIPTVNIQPGITGGVIYGPSKATVTVAYGDYMRDFFIKKGVPPEKIVITGQPRYDQLTSASSKYKKETFYKKIGIDSRKKIVSLITQPLPWEVNEPMISGVFGAMKNFPELQLISKPHPAEELKLHEKILKETGVDNVIIKKELDIFELLFSSEVVITMFSTVGLEAMILDKPVIAVNLTKTPDPYPYAKGGAAIGVYKPEDISDAIKKVLYDPEVGMALKKCRKKFVYEHAYKMDGLASRRVADLIEGMMDGK